MLECDALSDLLLRKIEEAAANGETDRVLSLVAAVRERVAALTVEHARLVAEQTGTRGRLEALVDRLVKANGR